MAFQGFLKQSTAVDILLGPFLDDTDGKTAETLLTISQSDVKLSKNGQALAQKNDVTAAAHDANGYYNCELDATDTNTVGQLTIICHESGALPVRLDYHIVEEAVYNAMYGASAAGPLQSTTAGRTLDIAATGEAGLDFGNVTGTLTQANVGWVDGNSRVDIGSWLGTAVTVSATTTKPEVDVSSISNDAMAANNAELAFDGTGYGFAGCTMPTVTTLTGHTAQTADHTANIAAILVDTGTTLETHLTDIKGGTFDGLTDSLEAIRNRGDVSWITAASVTVSDKTGFSLVADQSAVTIGTVNAATLANGAHGGAATVITGDITGNLSGSVGSVTGAVGSVTGAVGSVTGAVTVDTLSDGAIGAAAVADIFSTTAITEAYAADAAAGTPAQILYQIQQALTEFAISGTTLTVKKLDGSTAASTYTLDSATIPTSRTRAT